MKCHICQITKKIDPKLGHIPMKENRRTSLGHPMCRLDRPIYYRKKRETKKWKEEKRSNIMVCNND